jgi:hypothetical protein
MHALKCLSEGQSKTEIAHKFDGDQKVSNWIEFNKEINLLEENESGEVVVTDRAKAWIERYYHHGNVYVF